MQYTRYLVENSAVSISGCFSSVEYLEKSKHLQEQLKELRSEIEVLKVDENKSQFDDIHDQNVMHGNGKYTTISRVRDVFGYNSIYSFNSGQFVVFRN